MGAVYRARDGKLGRDVAIKFLQDPLSSDREYLRRFEREARAASALNHPNIITIFEIGEHEGAPFIAMELVEGKSLREVLKSGPLPLRKLLDVASQVADGLAAAHERGIVHRDLKPDNVMLTDDARVKILDFGLARVTRPSGPDEATSEFSEVRTPAGRVIGTASYVSPEQASGGRHVDYHSDQFSFGSLIYELATGRQAFARESTIETLAAILRDEPEPVQRINPKLPAPLVWIIERCLQKDPASRYASTRDLARELRTLRERLPETSPGFRRRPLTPRKRLMVAATIAVVLLTVAAIITEAMQFRARPAELPNQKYLAVLPFRDLSGRKDAELFIQGFGDAVSARLAKYPGIQVIPPAASLALVTKGAPLQRIAQEVGATLLLNASVQRTADRLRVSYAIVDPARKVNVSGDDINGTVQDVWTLQDEIADDVAADLGIRQRQAATQHVGLETADEQNLYVEALGALDHVDDPRSIDSAIDKLHELTESASDSPLVQAALGRAFLAKYTATRNREWSDRAQRACARARQLDPEAADVLFTTGEVERVTGQYQNAIETYKRALARRPDSPETMIGLAKAYQGARTYDDAERAFRRGIALRPTWWYGHHYLGILDLTRGRYDTAATQFKEVIRLDPENPWGYVNTGNVDLEKGDLSSAARMYQAAIRLRQDSDAYSNLGYCYYYLGDYDKAADCAKKATELKAGVAAYWASFADACRWSARCGGDVHDAYGKAIALLRQDLAVNQNSPRALASIAVCLSETGSKREADAFMKRALQLEPENPVRMYQAARVANASGDYAAAVEWFKRAVAAGYQTFEIERDPEFQRLRSTAAYKQLAAEIHKT